MPYICNMNKIERISAILVKLQSRRVVTAREIAEQFDISLRTVYRDIRILEEAGIPIAGNAGVGYSLVEGFKLPPLMFTTEEAIAFLMAEKLVSRHTDGDSYGLYCTGMDKIRAVLRTAEKDILDDFDKYIQLVDYRELPRRQPSQILQPLLHNIMQKREITIDYVANYNRQRTVRTVEPIGLYFMVDDWYLLAWCRLRQDYRTFKISRIQKLIPGEKGFEKEHQSLGSILNSLYSDEFFYEIKIRIQEEVLRDIANSRYTYGLYKEEPGEVKGTIIQYYSTHSLEYFGRWYLSFADKAEILEPPELKDFLHSLLKKITL